MIGQGSGAAEYGYDTDRVTDKWQARDLESTDDVYAEWALDAGMKRYSG